MIIRYCFICVFTVLMKVSLQVKVEAIIGGSVVLPCSLAKHELNDLKLQDVNVHWRHNSSNIVHDIVKGEESVDQQDPRFKNRTETFPDEYLRGNFSLKLNNLQHSDAGKYICYITHSSECQTVQLLINEPKTENQGANIVGASLPLIWVYTVLSVIVSVLL